MGAATHRPGSGVQQGIGQRFRRCERSGALAGGVVSRLDPFILERGSGPNPQGGTAERKNNAGH